ncbi:MAG: hypothetical protein K1X67_04215 [Fimbriimonadaceae bacterium]|nr:hypothetical protein [Fimbriimonadaceae bacterium]
MKAFAWVLFLFGLSLIGFPHSGSGKPLARQVLTVESMTKNMTTDLMARKLKPFEKSALYTLPSGASLAVGPAERLVNLVKDTGGRSLGYCLPYSDQPSDLPKNPWVAITKVRDGSGKSLEEKLFERLRGSQNLTPPEVLSLALDVTGNDYPLATLTAHNLLKEVAYAQASMVIGWDAKAGPTAKSARVVKPDQVLDHLINLRPRGDRFFSDKDGPWYHIYGIFFVGAVAPPGTDRLLAESENALRTLKFWATQDETKKAINTASAAMGSALALQVQYGIPVPADLSKLSTSHLDELRKGLQERHKMLTQLLVTLQSATTNPEFANAYRGMLAAMSDAVKRIDRELVSRGSSIPASKGAWKLVGHRSVEPKPIDLVAPRYARFTFVASPGSMNLAYLWNNLDLSDHRGSTVFTWRFDRELNRLRPGEKFQVFGTVVSAGERPRGSGGVSWQPPGLPSGVGHVSGISVGGVEVHQTGDSGRIQAETTVPNHDRFPNGLTLRFAVYCGGEANFEYVFDWDPEG